MRKLMESFSREFWTVIAFLALFHFFDIFASIYLRHGLGYLTR